MSIREFLISALVFIPSICLSKEIIPSVIYGEDNRRDIFRVSSPKIDELSLSIAGMTLKQNINQRPNSTILDLLTVPYGIQHNLCKDEIYYHQPTAMACTGFLIAPDLIATAGHCAQEVLCPQTAWIFDFTLKGENDPLNEILEDNIYYCKRILIREKDSLVDYGIIKLDRAVVGRPFLKLNLLKNVTTNTRLFTLGYPAGLPLKLIDSGKIRQIEKNYNFFTTDLDSFGGNSGSPVFNVKNAEVEGILVRGESDFEWDSEKDCRAVKRCASEACRGEGVTSIHFIADFLKLKQFK